MHLLAAFTFLLFLLPSCGLGPEGGEKGVAAPATLYLFSAPWCEPCTEELRALDTMVRSDLSEAARSRLTVQVFVISASLPSKPPTEQVVADYQAKLGISFPMKGDPWKYTTYRQYYPDGGGAVPGAVLLRPGQAAEPMTLGTKPEIVFGTLKAALGD